MAAHNVIDWKRPDVMTHGRQINNSD